MTETSDIPPPVPPPEPPSVGAPPPLSPSDERTYALLAHLSILLNLVTGFLGPVVPLLFYLIYKDRSRYLAYQSLQSLIFQLITWVGGGALIAFVWIVTSILTSICIGVVLIPIALLVTLLPLAALIYGVVGGIKCSQGEDFKYWLIGDWVRGTLTGN